MFQKSKMDRLRKVRLTDVNKVLTCSLCCGYLVDAITINVCMHSCKLELINRTCSCSCSHSLNILVHLQFVEFALSNISTSCKNSIALSVMSK